MITVGIIKGILHVYVAGAIVPTAGGAVVQPAHQAPDRHVHAEATAVEPAGPLDHWDLLADCESGTWDGDGDPMKGTAVWSSRAHALYQGGLQFHPDTWDGFRDPDMPDHAADATREQQIAVGKRVQAAQSWGAWPVCSRKVGLR